MGALAFSVHGRPGKIILISWTFATVIVGCQNIFVVRYAERTDCFCRLPLLSIIGGWWCSTFIPSRLCLNVDSLGTPRDLLQPLSGDLALPGISITYLVHSRDSRLWSFRISDPSILRFSVLLLNPQFNSTVVFDVILYFSSSCTFVSRTLKLQRVLIRRNYNYISPVLKAGRSCPPSTMRSIFLAIAAFSTAVLAQTATGPNPFKVPQGFSFTAGKPTDIQWNPTTPGTVTLRLREGANSDLSSGTVIGCKHNTHGTSLNIRTQLTTHLRNSKPSK